MNEYVSESNVFKWYFVYIVEYVFKCSQHLCWLPFFQLNSIVKVKQLDGEYEEGTVVKVNDHSLYTVGKS